jgi:hypothetical protein
MPDIVWFGEPVPEIAPAAALAASARHLRRDWHHPVRLPGSRAGRLRPTRDAEVRDRQHGEHVDLPDRFAYACSETAPPTAEAIGDLVQEALEDARTQLCEEHRRDALRGIAASETDWGVGGAAYRRSRQGLGT